jgi:predicted TIM-barrel fold metal-dependent hydrolase
MAPRREQTIEMLRWFDGEHRLVYSSDYPHWDADEIAFVSSRLPSAWHRRIFFENAMDFYAWTEADLPASRLEVST